MPATAPDVAVFGGGLAANESPSPQGFIHRLLQTHSEVEVARQQMLRQAKRAGVPVLPVAGITVLG